MMIGANIPDYDHKVDLAAVQQNPLSRYNPKLSAVDNLLANQKYTYEEIYLKKRDYDTPKYHYDWWLFPVAMPSDQYWSPTAAYYSLNRDRTYQLLANEQFRERYLQSIILYLNAQYSCWNKYEVRFGKVLLSLIHFINATSDQPIYQDLYQALIDQAKFAIKIAQSNGLNRDDFPYNAYHQMCNVLNREADMKAQQKDAPTSRSSILLK